MTAPLKATEPERQAVIAQLRLYAALHGLRVDSMQLERLLANVEKRIDASAVARVLEELGFEVRLNRSGHWRRLQRASLPLLIEGQNGALMLVGRIEPDAALVQRADRSEPERLSRAAFQALWSGRWIEAGLRTDVGSRAALGCKPSPTGRFGLSWFLRALRPYRTILSEVLLASFFIQVFALAAPLVFQVVIDKVLTHRTLTTLDVLALALAVFALFEVILAGLRHYLLTHTTHRVDLVLGMRLFRHLVQLPLAYFETRRAGDTVARIRELENARAFLTGPALTAGLDLVFVAVFLAVMFYYSPLLASIVLASLPVFVSISLATALLLRQRLEDKFALGAENQAFLVETVTAMETLKAQALERRWAWEWERRLAEYAQAAFQGG